MLTRQMLQGKILTVLGPIAPSDAGTVFPHEHILINHTQIKYPPDKIPNYEEMPFLGEIWLDDPALAITELQLLKETSTTAPLKNKTVVDVSGIGIRPDGYFQKLYYIASQLQDSDSAVHIVACTGLYKVDWWADEFKHMTVDQLCQLMTREIQIGTPVDDGSVNVHAGVIKVAITGEPSSLAQIDTYERLAIDAATLAYHETGAPLIIHFDAGGWWQDLWQPINTDLRLSVVDYLLGNNIPAQKIILSHGLIQPTAQSYYEEIKKRDVYVCAEFGTCVHRDPGCDNIQQNSIEEYKKVGNELFYLLNKSDYGGYLLTRLLFSHDICYNHMLWTNRGGGY